MVGKLFGRARKVFSRVRQGELLSWGPGSIADRNGDLNLEVKCKHVEVLGFRIENIDETIPAGDVARLALDVVEDVPGIPPAAQNTLAVLAVMLGAREGE